MNFIYNFREPDGIGFYELDDNAQNTNKLHFYVDNSSDNLSQEDMPYWSLVEGKCNPDKAMEVSRGYCLKKSNQYKR